MPRRLTDSNVDPNLLSKLEDAGYETIEDIDDTGLIQVIQELALTEPETTELLRLVQGEILPSQTLKEKLSDESKRGGVTSSCSRLDQLFGTYKGIPPCRITEFCGESGTGKTQLSIQLALNVQLPRELGGTDGECIYIDTEGSLVPSRLKAIAKNIRRRMKYAVSEQQVLEKLHVFRVLDHVELVALMRQLPSILKEHPRVKLVVLDSITFPLRLNIRDTRVRNGLISYIGQTLVQIANKQEVAVVVTNHVTVDKAQSGLTPAMGSTWGIWCSNRLFLYRKQQKRYAYLYQSSQMFPEKTIQFCITDAGICDAAEDEEAPSESAQAVAEAKENNDDDENLWGDKFLTDEILSQLPSQLSSGASLMEEEQEDSLRAMTKAPAKQKRSNDQEEDTLREIHKASTKRKRSRDQDPPDGLWSSDEDDDYLFLARYHLPYYY